MRFPCLGSVAGHGRLPHFGQSEVEHLYDPGIVHHDIPGLDVAVHDSRRVSSGQRGSDLTGIVQSLVDAQGSITKHLRQRPAGHELHHDEVVASVRLQLEDLHDVGMIECGDSLRLVPEPSGESPLRDFDCDCAIQPGVTRAENLTHSSGAQGRFNSICPQFGAGGVARDWGLFLALPGGSFQARIVARLIQ